MPNLIKKFYSFLPINEICTCRDMCTYNPVV